ncbi:hypothetical protein NJB1604_44710 [Mycobacterium marinum]|nr:hypothetical protein NJB1604_44710 [Mycobacterium marinum]
MPGLGEVLVRIGLRRGAPPTVVRDKGRDLGSEVVEHRRTADQAITLVGVIMAKARLHDIQDQLGRRANKGSS